MWLNGVSLCIQGPEGVSEQVLGIVKLLDLAQARPIVTEARLRAFSWFVTSKEL